MIATSIEKLDQCLRERIVVLDGAMGTVIQQRQLDEAAYRGERFRDWPKDLKGNHDVLNLTQPQVIEEIHRQYLEAGADIIETNTFNSQAISLADYRMEALAYELSKAGADCARRAANAVMAAQPGRLCVVAGAIGPTTRTSSISTDVNNSAARATTFDELVAAYYDQGRGLMDGGADALLVETIFDTLNAKAAFFALEKLFEERRVRLPLLASVTFIQAGSNRGITGQTVEAFWNSISHVPLLSVGINCALGPKEMRPLIEELAATIADGTLKDNFLHRATAMLPQTRPLSPKHAAKQAFGGLTTREREVAALIAQGKFNREIADLLVVSERTIETHVSNIMFKLGFSSRRQIAAWTVEKGLTSNS